MKICSVFLLRNENPRVQQPLASFAICFCRQRIGHERTVHLC